MAFTHAQIEELMSNYGRVDILWLDGGWVRTLTPAQIQARINAPDYKFLHIQSLDIDMPGLVDMARRHQPGLIVVNRAVPGPYQDYLTPEARVPDKPIPHPWEVPMPMATSWSYVPHDTYKPPRAARAHAGGRGGQGRQPPPQHRARTRRHLGPERLRSPRQARRLDEA